MVRLADPLWAMVVLAAMAGAAAVVAWPEVGLLILVFLTYTHLPTVLVDLHGAPEVLKLFPVVFWGLLLVRWALYGDRASGWQRSMLLVGLFGLSGVVSLMAAVDLREGQYQLLRYAKDVLVVALVGASLHRWVTLRRVAWTLVLAGGFLGTITAYQWLTGTLDRPYWGFGQVPFASGGLDLDRASPYRLAGPVGDPNFYAQLLLAPIALGVERCWRERGWLARALATWTVVVCLVSVIGTYSRGAAVALVAMALVPTLRTRRSLVPVGLLAVAVLVAVPLLPGKYTVRLSRLGGVESMLRGDLAADRSVSGRLTEMLSAWSAFVDHPIIGVGVGNFSSHYQRYAQQVGLNVRLVDRPAHSLYLEIAAEQGVVGLAAFAGILVATYGGIFAARRRLLAREPPERASLLAALATALTGCLTAALFLQSSYPHALWLLIGIGLAAHQVEGDRPLSRPVTAGAPVALRATD